MNNRYAQEIEDFNRHFEGFRDKKIVLYGIGRFTATLVENLKGFQIVGLLDKDPDNIGKTIFDLPVLSKTETQKKADTIIINTAGTYWDLIYSRISDWGVPVYFRNGEKAKERKNFKSDNPYWKNSYEELKNKAKEADIVSFDFYGTLFLRTVSNPKDVFEIVEVIYETRFGKSIGFPEIRSKAVASFPEGYTLDDLYYKMQEIGGWSENQVKRIRNIELELERKLLAPRIPVLDLMQKLLRSDKEIYVISDMYLPGSFFRDSLRDYGIELDPSHIWISGEKRADKGSGRLWGKFDDAVNCNNTTVLHVGDDIKADIKNAAEHNIQTYYVSDWMSLLSMSSLNGMESRICSLSDSLVTGLIAAKIFQDPFGLNKQCGQIRIADPETMGYCVFGPVILSFFQWLDNKIREDDTDRVVFMARDGYFLNEDYDHYQLCRKGDIVKTAYIGISRQLAMMASIENDADLWEYINMPYSGTPSELLEDRFGLTGLTVDTKEEIEKYFHEIWERVNKVKKNYRRYVDSFRLGDKDTVIDLGYYGNNQRYLRKISGADISGYYFNANITTDNPNVNHQKMKVCFQKEDDLKGEKSQILKYQIFIESLLTAPYGMITEVDKDGKFLCKPKGNNQRHFNEKRKINTGVKSFITDFLSVSEKSGLIIDPEFADYLYGRCMDGSIFYSDEVKASFFNDNAMMNRRDSSLFS